MRVGYTAFGAMAVSVDGTTHALTRRRERGVLAVLLAARGAPVSAERLLVEVWGDGSAGQGLAAVQVAVSRLRSLVEPDRAVRGGTRLVSTTAGYAVRAATDDVDTWAFEAGAEATLAAPDPTTRLARAERTLAAWTADPFADVDAPSVRAEADRLAELRLVTHEQRAQALLDLGRPDEAHRGLAATADQHPYRERLWSLLALAQYRAARQADALATLRTLRTALADELGVDPLPETRALEEAVLRQDADLAGPGPAEEREVPAPPGRSLPGPDAVATDLVGRRGELERLTALAADPRPRTRFALVTGEAGIGKSRVVAELAARAAAAGVRVLTGQCVEGGYAPPLWPWTAVVRPLVEDAGADPVLAPLTDDVPPPDAGPGATVRLHDAVAGLLGRSAAQHPLLVVLEDVHWADDSSLLLLRHLATTLPAAPVTVVCTRRSADTAAAGPLLDTLATLARAGAERVRLDGLDAAEVGALLTAALGTHAPRVGALVAEVTGGNPFFVEQYARLLATLPDPAAVDPSSLPVPDGVADVLRQRLARLPDEVAGLLSTAAVLGRHVDPDLLADLAGVPLDRCLDALDLALTSGLLEEADAGYAFVHALARETLYAGLSAARRLRLHDRAGRLGEARSDPGRETVGTTVGEPGHGPVAEVAAHARLAAPLGPEHAARAVTWLARAAELAAARTAHPEARDLWRAVLAVAPPGSADAVRAHRGTATALLRLGDVEAAQAELGRAITLAGEHRDWDAVADAAAVLVSAGPWTWREHGVLHEPLVGVMSEAVEHVEPARRARLLALLQVEHFYRWRSDEVEVQGRRSVEVAREVGDPALLREVLLLRIIASTGSWDARGRLALVEELMALEPEGELGVTALFHLGQVRWDGGDPAGADEAVRRCAEAAASLRHAGLDIPLAWWRAARARDRDDPAYDALLADAVERHRAAGYFANRELSCLHAVRSGPVGAPVEPSTVALAEEGGMPLRALVAHALLESGDPAGAHALLGPRVPDTIVDYCSTAGRCLRLLVLAETGTPGEVAEALAPLEGHLGAPVSYGSIDHLGVVDHFVAAGYAALGDGRAVEVARSAVAGNHRIGVLPWWRRSQGLLARLTS